MQALDSSAKSGVVLIEEAFTTLLHAPRMLLFRYYLGAAPFCIAFMYYWADMRQSAFAYERYATGALLLSVLFVWMKSWQTWFARGLYGHVAGESTARPTPAQAARVAANQTLIHATGFVTLPVALLILLPLGRAYAFYQNVTVLDTGEARPVRDLMNEAWQAACWAERQNIVLMWLIAPLGVIVAASILIPLVLLFTLVLFTPFAGLIVNVFAAVLIVICPIAMIVALNIAVTLIALPILLDRFLGIETVFTLAPGGLLDPLVMVVVCMLSYLCLDPLVKTAYVLRCFYAASRHTGQDLRLALLRAGRRRAATTALLIAGLAAAAPGAAQESPPRPPADAAERAAALDNAIETVLEDRAYAWRMPRPDPPAEQKTWLEQALQSVNELLADIATWTWDWLKRIWEWLFPQWDGMSTDPSLLSGVSGPLRVTLYTLTGILAALILLLVWRAWRQRSKTRAVAAEPVVAVPNLEDESIRADDLPDEEWISLGEWLLREGQYRLAMRAFFLAGLARLAGAGLIRLASHKSNRDYARELARIEHAEPELWQNYDRGMRMFEAVWYGLHEISRENLERYIQIQAALQPRTRPAPAAQSTAAATP